MNAKSAPLLTPEDLATERLVGAVESAIGGIQERLPDLASEDQGANWSVSDLIRLIQLRNQLQGERPRTIFACWVDDPRDPHDPRDLGNNYNNDHNDNDQPEI